MTKGILTVLGIASVLFMYSCGGDNKAGESDGEEAKSAIADKVSTSSYDPNRGEGKFDETNVTLGALDVAMAAKGKAVAETKCFSCHKLTDEKLVGPGWQGVTERRNAHWIMNFITNPDPMIDKDPEVQAQLELCLVRMPNQNLAEAEARDIVEFMRENDGVK